MDFHPLHRNGVRSSLAGRLRGDPSAMASKARASLCVAKGAHGVDGVHGVRDVCAARIPEATPLASFHAASHATLRAILLAILLAAFVFLIAACSAGTTARQSGSSPASPASSSPPSTTSAAPRALTSSDAVGVWSLTDDENTTFDVRLSADGKASSNWSKGPTGAAGESGRWVVDGHRIVVDYVDGWRDVIVSTGDGRFLKESFAPSADRGGPPTNRGQSVRTPIEIADWVGVYQVAGKAHLAIQSSQVAWRTGATPPVGSWWLSEGAVWIRWADGSLESLRAIAGAKGTSHELCAWGGGPVATSKPLARASAVRLP